MNVKPGKLNAKVINQGSDSSNDSDWGFEQVGTELAEMKTTSTSSSAAEAVAAEDVAAAADLSTALDSMKISLAPTVTVEDEKDSDPTSNRYRTSGLATQRLESAPAAYKGKWQGTEFMHLTFATQAEAEMTAKILAAEFPNQFKRRLPNMFEAGKKYVYPQGKAPQQDEQNGHECGEQYTPGTIFFRLHQTQYEAIRASYPAFNLVSFADLTPYVVAQQQAAVSSSITPTATTN